MGAASSTHSARFVIARERAGREGFGMDFSDDPREELRRSLELIDRHELDEPYFEVGHRTYDWLQTLLLAEAPMERVDSIRDRFECGSLGISFNGRTLKRCLDVPERALWPPREKGTTRTARKVEADNDATGQKHSYQD